MLKEALKGFLSESEVSLLYGGFDVVGDIAVVKIPDSLLEKKRLIAEAIIQRVKPVKTVLRQTTPVSGEYRVRGLELLAGEDKTETVYREHGCTFKVDLAKVYFSPRLSTERLRITQSARDGETVVNMFAGIGTFSILLAKKVVGVEVYSIDVNPDAYKLMVENIELNRLSDRVIPILGDARRVIEERLRMRADRVLMPLPEQANRFLDVAVEALKPAGGIVHYYTHIYAKSPSEAFEEARREIGERIGSCYEEVFHRVVREVGPRWWQLVVDLKIGGGMPPTQPSTLRV